MDKSCEPPKLSLVAQFDDLCRFANSFVSVDEECILLFNNWFYLKFFWLIIVFLLIFLALKQLILNAEENRVLWLSAKRELDSMKDRMKKLEKENNDLKANLQRVRFSFGKEVQNREDLIKQRNALKNQLNAIKECVLEDPIAQQSI